MNKKIIISLSVIGVVAAIAIGGTIAYFSDTETSTGNTFIAGTLDLSVNGQNPLEGPVITIEDLKPSGVKESEPILLRIVDNPGHLYKRIKDLVCETGKVSEPECVDQGGVWQNNECDWGGNEDNNNLPSATWFDLKVNGNVFIADEQVKIEEIDSKWIYLGKYQPQTDIEIVQSFHLDKGTKNWAQGDKCTFVEEFMVLQTRDSQPADCYNCPLADWRFNEGTGDTAYDSSGNEHHGTISGASWENGALNFDGIDDFVETGDTGPNLQPLSFSAWIYPESISSYGSNWVMETTIISKSILCLNSNGWWTLDLQNEQDGKVALYGFINYDTPAESLSTASIELNKWHSVAMTYDESGDRKIHLYIDGQEANYEKQVASEGTRYPDEFTALHIGDKECATDTTFDGKIDEVQLYNRVLSAGEILERYNAGL